jgi:pSer/pThr/pTyr-binding forkhead associated (FHA) protein
MTKKDLQACIKIVSDTGAGHPYILTQHRYLLGSGSDADICIPDLDRHHCLISLESGEWVLNRINDNSVVKFRDQSIDLKKLNAGDSIDLGIIKLLFSYNRQDTGTAQTLLNEEINQVGSWLVSISKGPDKGKNFMLRPGVYSIGRDSSGTVDQIGLSDPYISKNHASVTIDDQGVYLEDLGSKNGLQIGLIKRKKIRKNEEFKVKTGKTVMQFTRLANSPSQATTAVAMRPGFMKRCKIIPILSVLAVVCIITLVIFIMRNYSTP